MTFGNSPDHSWVVVSTGQARDIAGQRCRTNFGNIENNLFLEIPLVTFMESLWNDIRDHL